MTEKEIIDTIKILYDHDYIMLHCRSLYPTPLDHVNLNRINWLKEQGVRKVGFSDHSLDTEAAKAAMTMGISCLEKHLTLDRTWPGKDQQMSTTPDEFKEICQWRDLCETMLGQPTYPLTNEEYKLREIYIGKWGDNA